MTGTSSAHAGASRPGLFVAAGLLVVGLVLGWGIARWTQGDVDPDGIRNAAEMEEAVRTAMSESSAFLRSRQLTRVFSSLDEDNVVGAVRGMRTRSEFLDPVDLQVFLSAWTRFNAFAAMREAQNWPSTAGREIGMRIVMREWAASGRVIEAGHFFQSLDDPESRSIVGGPLIRGWALSGDIEGALKRARLFWDQGEPIDVVDGFVRGALVSVGAATLIERVVSLDPNRGGDFEHRLMRVALKLGAREDLLAASAAYASLVGDTTPEWLVGALQAVAVPWAETDPTAAIGWLLARVDTPERTIVMKEVVRRWSIQDLDAAWAWWTAEKRAAEPGSIEEVALRSILLPPILRVMARVRPIEASVWIEEIEKPARKEALILRVAYFWAQGNPNDARSWADRLGLPGAVRAKVEEAISRGAVEAGGSRQPEEATEAAEQTPDETSIPLSEPSPEQNAE